MERCVYARYNRERLPQFQTETLLLQSVSGKRVKKAALTPAARMHIAQMKQNYQNSRELYPQAELTEATEDSLYFRFVAGQSLDEKLAACLAARDKESVIYWLQRYKDWIDRFGRIVAEPRPTIWLEQKSTDLLCLPEANIDLTFENILIEDTERFVVIDCEWVFPDIPVAFIYYRTIAKFFCKYSEYLSNAGIALIDLYDRMGLKNEQIEQWQLAEQSFQRYVYGTSDSLKISPAYIKPVRSLSELQNKATCADMLVQQMNHFGLLPIGHAVTLPEVTDKTDPYQGALQLFVSEDDVFHEEKSIVLLRNSGCNCYSFAIDWVKKLYALRLDPLDDSCVLQLDSAHLVDCFGGRHPVTVKSTNADRVESKLFFFSSKDPQLHFDLKAVGGMQYSSFVVAITYLDPMRECLFAALREQQCRVKMEEMEDELHQSFFERAWRLACRIKKLWQNELV